MLAARLAARRTGSGAGGAPAPPPGAPRFFPLPAGAFLPAGGAFHLAGRAGDAPGHLSRLIPRPGFHVGLGNERLDRLAEFLPGPLDFLGQPLQTFRRGRAAFRGRAGRQAGPFFFGHRCALSLISSTSALTLSTARAGTGGAALPSCALPNMAAPAEMMIRAAPMIRAASQAATAVASAMIAAASRQPMPYRARMPPPPNAPMPSPARLPLRVISSCASRSSSRTSRVTCSDICLMSSEVELSWALAGRTPVASSMTPPSVDDCGNYPAAAR